MPAQSLRRFLVAASSLLMTACAAELLPRPPPADAFYFPTGVLHLDDPAAPTAQGFLYVVSSNFDRRFDTGAVTALDLSKVEGFPPLAAPGSAPTAIAALESLPSAAESQVYVGSFAGQLAARRTEAGTAQLLIASRSDGSPIQLIEASGAALECRSGSGRNCFEGAQGLERRSGGVNVPPSAPEPFAVAVAPETGTVFVSHLEPVQAPDTTTAVDRQHFLVRLSIEEVAEPTRELEPEKYIGIGLGAANAIAVGRKWVFLSGRFSSGRATAPLVRAVKKDSGQVLAIGLEGPFRAQEARGIALSPDGRRLFVTTRNPDSLLVVSVDESAADVPRLELVKALFLPEGAGPLAVIPRTTRASLVAVSSQNAGVVSLYDDEVGQLVGSIPEVGEQPFDIAVDVGASGNPDAARLYVTNFGDGRVAVIDIPDVNAPSDARRVAYLGRTQTCLTDEKTAVCPGGVAR